MSYGDFSKSVQTFSLVIVFIFLFVFSVNRVDASSSQQSDPQFQVCQNFDIVYLLDLSGSMAWSYEGGASRLDSAKDAIYEMNGILEADGAGIQASLMTWQGTQTNLVVDLTNDFGSIDAALAPLTASGATPAAAALRSTQNLIETTFDPERIPIVLFITDGIPTADLDGYYYYDPEVNQVPVINPNGGYYSARYVRSQGVYYWDYDRYAGHPLADAMVSARRLSRSMPNGVINSIAIVGTDFRQDLVRYVAHVGGGEYYAASNAGELAAAIQQSVYSVDCPSTLEISVDNIATYYLGGTAQPVDPSLTVISENENVASAVVQIEDNFDPSNDSLFVGESPADSGVINGLSWWYQASTGTLEIIGVDTPEAYQNVMRQIRFANSAQSQSQTYMDRRRVSFTISSAFYNTYDPGTLTDDGFVDLVYLEGTDFGDANSSYGSAGIEADMFLRLGDTVDVESHPLHSNDALGDDFHQSDDEDGITFVSGNTLYRSSIGTVEVQVYNQRQNDVLVEGWIDFNRDGLFNDSTEKLMGFSLSFDQQSNNQIAQDSFFIPGDSDCGPTAARFRLSTDVVNASEDSALYGETEDYQIDISCDEVINPDVFDFGDAPSSYGDALHRLLTGMQLGDAIDSEALALNSPDAQGDDNAEFDDEDGVTFASGPIALRGDTVTVQIHATNSVHLDSFVNGWADWNQDGTFDPLNEQIIIDEIIPLSPNAQTRTVNFIVPNDAACGDTYLRVRLASESVGPEEVATTGEAEDYIFHVDCTVEQGIKITPLLAEVMLEQTIELMIEADNTGPNAAPNTVVTVTLPLGLDIQQIDTYGDWACSLNGTETVLNCAQPLMQISDFVPVVKLHIRVPGTFKPNTMSGQGEIWSDYPERVGYEDDNDDSYDVNVVKEWGVIESTMTAFTHAIYDDTVTVNSADLEQDFEITEVIANKFQVPISLLPSLDVTAPPRLRTSYCDTHDTAGCNSSDAMMTGTIRLNSFVIDTIMMQDINPVTGHPSDVADGFNLITTPEEVFYGSDGRFAEADLATCEGWITQLAGGNCTTRYETFNGYPDPARYVWGSTEYFELIIHSAGGTQIDCSGTSGACETLNTGRPGVYRLSGVMKGDMIFNDPTHKRIGEDSKEFDFEYPVNIYVRVVSSFLEPEKGN